MIPKQLYWKNGESADDICQFIRRKISENKPQLFYLEPRPVKPMIPIWPIRNITCFGKDFPEGNILLEEARLYWLDRSINVVAKEDGGCFYFEFGDTELQDGHAENVTLAEADIILRKDFKRFGIVDSLQDDKVKIIKYISGNRILAWRIVPQV